MDLNCNDNMDIINIQNEKNNFDSIGEIIGDYKSDEDFMIEKIKQKDQSLKFVFGLYKNSSQKNYDDEEMVGDNIEILQKMYSSLDEFNNDKEVKKSGAILKKVCFYVKSKDYEFYKNDAGLKLEHLLPKSLVMKQWMFK